MNRGFSSGVFVEATIPVIGLKKKAPTSKGTIKHAKLMAKAEKTAVLLQIHLPDLQSSIIIQS